VLVIEDNNNNNTEEYGIENSYLDLFSIIGSVFFLLATIGYLLTVFSNPGYVEKDFSLIVTILTLYIILIIRMFWTTQTKITLTMRIFAFTVRQLNQMKHFTVSSVNDVLKDLTITVPTSTTV
jgi:cytochrome c oxidase subunit IV